MHLPAALCGISAVVCILLDSSQGAPQVSCQQPLPTPFEFTCPCQQKVLPIPPGCICPCQHQALPTPPGYVCPCQQEVLPNPPGYVCPCQQQVLPNPPGYVCPCQQEVLPTPPGYVCPCQQPLPTSFEFTCPCQKQVPPTPPGYQQAPVFSPPSPPSYEYPSPPAASTPNAPCTNCNDDFQNVPTLNITLPELLAGSPYYLAAISGRAGENQVDSACYTYFPLNGMELFLNFVVIVSASGAYTVSTFLVSGTEQPGKIRAQGLEGESAVSSVVNDVFAFGQVSCLNCSSVPLTAIYSTPFFADCSVAQVTTPYVYVLSATSNLSPVCLAEAAQLFGQAGFPACDAFFPSYQLKTLCVTSFNGVPCINAESVPACSSLAMPSSPAYGCNI